MSALDDFFAKKDRKKKGIKSVDNTKNIKKDNTKDQPIKKDKVSNLTDGFKYISNNQNEEWLDFEENRDKDYSGLKINNLSLKDKEQVLHEQKLAELDELKNDGENVWSSKQNKDEEEKKEIVEEKKVEEEKKDEPKIPKKYIPPSLRQSLDKPLSDLPKRLIKNKTPEIKSNSEFPTLG